jgi:hypothetical protein
MTPFLNGRKSVAGAALSSPQPSAPGCLPGMIRSEHRAESGPTIDVVKEGDKVVRLIVKCSCGERLEIECLYSA